MLTDFLSPVDGQQYNVQGKPIRFYNGHDSELDNCRIAILGVMDSRGHAENNGCELAPNAIRQQLYKLHNFPSQLKIIDLGNIFPGETFSDTHAALKEVVAILHRRQLITIILGGDMSLTLAQYKGMAHSDLMISLAVVDERLTLLEAREDSEIHESNYLFRLFTEKPNRIEDFKLLGYQTYFNQLKDLEVLEQMQMDCYRLGMLREDMLDVEPHVRDADMLAFNISALKACDAPGYTQPSPNGFFSDEACQILRFAGASDKLSCLGIYNFNPELDQRNITAIGIAQMIWYFIEGVEIRKGDYPVLSEKGFQKYIVVIEGHDEITFLKSLKSDRWWMHIPVGIKGPKYHKMVPCSYKDYLTAVNNNEVPERWINAFSRLN
jgi:formiminoglutamase